MRHLLCVVVAALALAILVQDAQCAKGKRQYQSGRLYLSQGLFDKAAEQFEKAVMEDPNNGKYHYELAKSYAELDRNEDAGREFKIALEKAPELSEEIQMAVQHYMADHFNTALDLIGSKSYEAAVEQLHGAIALDDSHLNSYIKMGYCLLQLGKTNEAASWIRKALELDPSSEQAQELLKAIFPVRYDVRLAEVERPPDAAELFGDQKITKIEEEASNKYVFEDDLMNIVWLVGESQLSFVLLNRTDHSIKIPWDEAAYVDIKGESHRVFHSGIKYSERDRPQPPSVVVRGGKLTDVISPADYVYYAGGDDGWRHSPLFPTGSHADEQRIKEAHEYVGKTIQLLLPLVIQGVVNEYIFTFEVIDASLQVEHN